MRKTIAVYLLRNKTFAANLARSWGLVAAVDVVAKGLNFVFFPIYAKVMSPAEYGAFNYACIISGVACLVFGLGQYANFTRAESEEQDKKISIHLRLPANIFLGMLLWLAFALVVMLFFRSLLFASHSSALFLIVVVLMPLTQILLQLISIDFFLTRRYGIGAVRSFYEFFLVNALGMSAVIAFPKISGDARLASLLVANLLLIFVYLPKSRLGCIFRLAIKRQICFAPCWADLREGLPLSLNGIIGLSSGNGDRYMLEKLAAKEQLGIYAFAASIMSVLNMGFASFNNVWLGIFYQDGRTDKWRVKMSLLVGLMWLVISVTAVVIAMLMFSFFGKNMMAYIGARSLLVYLGAAYCFQIQTQLLNNFFNLFKMNYYAVPVNLLVGVASLFMGYLLIPRYGVVGAAIQALSTSAIGFLLLLLLLAWSYRRRDGLGRFA